MSFSEWPTTGELLDVFTTEVAACGGSVSRPYDDGVRLYARGVLPAVREVGPGDGVQGGVAVRATLGEVRVHPYVFRQVCSNGAIGAESLQTRRVVQAGDWPADEDEEGVLELLRRAVRACCAPAAFARSAAAMRAARTDVAHPDFLQDFLVHIFSIPNVPASLVREILMRFEQDLTPSGRTCRSTGTWPRNTPTAGGRIGSTPDWSFSTSRSSSGGLSPPRPARSEGVTL